MWRLAIMMMLACAALAACGGGGVDIEEFERRMDARHEATFTISYEQETMSPAGTEVAEVTWYQGPLAAPRREERYDYSGEDGSLTYILGHDGYTCADVGDQRRCEVSACCPVLRVYSYFMYPTTADGAMVTGSRGETIAGNEAECYEVDLGDQPSVAYSTLDVCLSEDGLFLGGTTGPFEHPDPDVQGIVVSMTATDVRREVAEDAFEPPYPVVDRRTFIPPELD